LLFRLVSSKTLEFLTVEVKKSVQLTFEMQDYEPLTARSGNSIEPVPQVVFITMVAVGAEVEIIALGTFEPDTENWLLPTGVTHRAVVFHPCELQCHLHLCPCYNNRTKITDRACTKN
jgi:hypothetical protein